MQKKASLAAPAQTERRSRSPRSSNPNSAAKRLPSQSGPLSADLGTAQQAANRTSIVPCRSGIHYISLITDESHLIILCQIRLSSFTSSCHDLTSLNPFLYHSRSCLSGLQPNGAKGYLDLTQ